MLRRVITFLRKRKVEGELDDELKASVDLLAEEHIRQGLSRQEAVRLARIELGGVEQVKEEIRDVRGLPLLDSVMRDFQHALRNLVRAPGFSIAVVATLGVALGANASLLALLDRLILRPLPVKEPASLVVVDAPPLPERPSRPGGAAGGGISIDIASGRLGISYPLYAALRSRVGAFTDALAEAQAHATMDAGGTPVRVDGRLVTGNYFELLGVEAALGRLLTPADDDERTGSPVVLSHGLWQRQFGGDAAILSRTVRLNRHPMTVVGVAAQGFTGSAAGEAPDFFLPLHMGRVLRSLSPAERAAFRVDAPNAHEYKVMARLAPGIDLAKAEMAGNQVYQQLLAEALDYWSRARKAPPDYGPLRRKFGREQRLRLSPGGYASSKESALSRDLRTPLLLLMAMVGLVLAIAAGNVANLFLARGEARSRELAIRFALGASRWRVLCALLVESLVLTLTAGGLGLVLARWTTWLAPVVFNIERLPDGVTPAPDLRIGAAVLVLSLAVGFCIWAASALRAVGGATLAGLAAQVRAGVRRTLYWRRALVAAQAALSVVLLCGSAVLSRSLMRLVSVDPGFSVDHLYSFWLNPARSGLDPVRSSAILSQVFDQLSGIPGVKAVSIATELPLSGPDAGGFMNGEEPSSQEGEGIDTRMARAGPGHFANLGMAIVAGREFSRDDMNGAKVAVISQALAQKLFGKSDPVGRRLGSEGERWQVVGVLKDIKPNPRDPALRRFYTPYRFRDPAEGATGFAIRAGKGVRITSEMVREVVRRVESSLAVDEFDSMAEQAARALNRDRMVAWVSVSFAMLAALLCAIGIFGLTSFSIARRTQEIGVRITLGATRTSIQWMVMREVFVLSVAGCGVGVMAFLYGGRVLSTMLFDLTPTDPASLATGALVLCCTALLAGLVPAWRASLVDPARTLRQE